MATDSANPRDEYLSADIETIQTWADRHNAVPIREGADGTLALVHESKIAAGDDRLDWETFHDGLKSENCAVSYRGDGLESPKVLTHDQAISRSDVKDKQIRNRLVAGETVTSTLHETSAVETPVIEEATVESELVSREIIYDELLDVELVERTCTDSTIVPSDESMGADVFDQDQYFASIKASRNDGAELDSESSVEASPPHSIKDKYQTQIQIREVWVASREVTERFTIESRITGTDIAEAETLEDYELDTKGLQRSIIEQGMLDAQEDPEEVKKDFEIESELGEGDQIHTHFTRKSVVEDEVITQIQAGNDIDRVDFAKMDFTASNHVVNEEATETMRSGADGMSLTEDDIGKDVMDATGSNVGTVKAITDGGQTAYVEPHSTISERIMSSLGGSDADESEIEIFVGQCADITHESIQLKEHEQLDENRQAD